jgi:hypothetical protein
MGVDNLRDIPNGVMAKWVQLIFAIVTGPLLVYLIVQVSIIRGNRYTATDALADQRLAAAAITGIMAELADLRVRMAEETPREFVDRVRAIEERLRLLEISTARAHTTNARE